MWDGWGYNISATIPTPNPTTTVLPHPFWSSSPKKHHIATPPNIFLHLVCLYREYSGMPISTIQSHSLTLKAERLGACTRKGGFEFQEEEVIMDMVMEQKRHQFISPFVTSITTGLRWECRSFTWRLSPCWAKTSLRWHTYYGISPSKYSTHIYLYVLKLTYIATGIAKGPTASKSQFWSRRIRYFLHPTQTPITPGSFTSPYKKQHN